MPKILGFKFQSHNIKIDDFKINPINFLTPLAPRGGGENFKPITRNVLHYEKEVKFWISESWH